MSDETGNGDAHQHLLALKGFTKTFGPVQALVDVDFEVDAGEIVALVGDNGAGKSTLIKAIDGVQPADKGEMYFEGERVNVTGPQHAARLGIATVFQDLALCDNLDVVANLYLGQEVTGNMRVKALNETEMEKHSLKLLDELAVTTLGSVRTPVGSLSGGQRQSVAIARSLVGAPKVILFDEPTAALGVSQTEQVLHLEKRLAERGLGVVVISHNLANVFAVADRIVVLRLGRRVASFKKEETTREEVVATITGADTDHRTLASVGEMEELEVEELEE
ncbi:MAG TPA: ATP-binding cassette domain-containing protein [Solirubrobacterales bacterium]|nr:ATP-binding cassette domain-containing protein [Solirubrobacterales bacterium]